VTKGAGGQREVAAVPRAPAALPVAPRWRDWLVVAATPRPGCEAGGLLLADQVVAQRE